MSTALADVDRVFTREEYRLWYDAQLQGRFERVDGRIVAMASERVGHVRVKSALWLALRRAIATAGVPCEAFGDGMTVETGENDFEPDAVVSCGERLGNDEIAVPSPVIIAEVLSPETRTVDTGLKLASYFVLPSLMHYLVIDPRKPLIIHYSRLSGRIEATLIHAGAVSMDPPGIAITIDEIYETS